MVGRTRRRMTLLASLDVASRASSLALVLFALAVVATRLGWWSAPPARIAASCVGLVLAAVGIWFLRRRRLDHVAAARIDAEFGLEDRLRTALALLDAGPRTSMEEAVIADAAVAAARIDPARAVAWRLPAWAPGLAAAGVLVVAATLAPERLFPGAEARAAAAGDIQEAGRLLEARSIELAQPDPRTSEALRALAREQAALGAELARDPGDRAAALERLSAMEERIDRASRGLDGAAQALDRTRRRMEKALSSAAKAGDSGHAREESDSRKSFAEKAGEAAERARSGDLDAEHADALADAARELARELEGVEGAEELRDAAEALADGEATAEDLERLAEALEAAEGRAAEREAAERLRAANRAAKQRAAGRRELEGRDQIAGEHRNGPFAGRGSTNDREGARYETEEQPSTMADGDERPTTRGRYDAKAASERIGEQGFSTRLRGEMQPGGRGTSLFVRAAPGAAPAQAPYQQVYPQYRRSAERAVERTGVPADRREVVREYFDSINPDGQ